MRAVHVAIIFCSSRGCLWECVTVKTRFCRLKKLSIFIVINIFCGVERSLHPFGLDFDTVLNSLLLSDSTLTDNGIRNTGLQKQNIVVQLLSYGDLQSEI